MSGETSQWLNQNVLIGNCLARGREGNPFRAWHFEEGAQGDESNHYDTFIPVGDVQRRLFNFTAERRRVAVEVPATIEDMTHLDAEGRPAKWTVQDDRQAIARSDDHAVMGLFKAGYEPHQYDEWLLGTVSNILSDTLNITSAGLIKSGAVAWVEISVPDTFKTQSGVRFLPNLLAFTSFDGSLATGWKRTHRVTVCDNTFYGALASTGLLYKVKHTKHSSFKLADAQAALELVQEAGDEFAAEVDALAAQTVTSRQWDKFLEALAPTQTPVLSKREVSLATTKQDTLRRLWNNDPRVTPWKGTVWGVLQAHNTYQHWEGIVRGKTRPERNALSAIDGSIARADDEALKVLASVLA